MKIDHELLTACVVNPWAVTPRMMLIDSMIENGYSEFKAMEAFEPPTISRFLPSTYSPNNFGGGLGNNNGRGSGSGSGFGYGSNGCSSGHGRINKWL